VITVVSGFGRCGSSLVMQMLVAGGFPVYADEGTAPAYETAHMLTLPRETAWLDACEGKAVKVLDPHVFHLPSGRRYRSVWLDRDPDAQAASMVKFQRTLFGQQFGREEQAAILAALVADRPEALGALMDVSERVLVLSFEELLATPAASAAALSDFCGGGLRLLPMGRAVRRRSSACAADMAGELPARKAS